MALTFDSALDSIGKVANTGVDAYNKYSENKTNNQVKETQAKDLWNSNRAQDTAKLNNSKMYMIGGIIVAIGFAFFLFNRKA